MQQASNVGDSSEINEILKMVETVKSSFKKSGIWNSKKLVKYVPQRLKEVVINKSYNNNKFS